MNVWNASTCLGLCSVLVLSTAGCKPRAGVPCQAGQYACTDDKNGLFCGADGKFAAMTCSGGCRLSGSLITCDNSIAAVSDGCAQPGDVACTSDHKNALECGKDAKFAVAETCKGPRGCTITGDTLACDNDTSDLNDPCRMPGDYACTSDKAMVLRCDDHKMVALNSCRGPKACRIFELPQEKKVDFVCDDSLAEEGDPWDTNGEEACTTNKACTCAGRTSSPATGLVLVRAAAHTRSAPTATHAIPPQGPRPARPRADRPREVIKAPKERERERERGRDGRRGPIGQRAGSRGSSLS
jgi:hypothetical protein